MIRVLHLVYSNMGGASSVVFSLIEADKKKSLDQSILFTGPKFSKYFSTKCKKLMIKSRWIRTIKYFFFISYISTFNQIIKFKPDVILLHNYNFIPCIFYKIFFQSVKIIYVNHKALNLIDFKDMMMKYFHIFLDKLVFINKESYLFAKKNFKISSHKILLIKNGINIDFFNSTFVKKKNVFTIGMACRVNKLKCYDLIASALNSDLLKKYNIQFTLAGDGEDLSEFKIRIKDLGIKKKIKFVGNLNEINLKKWYSQLDLYIQASLGEGAPISLIQAMSMGVPVIGSRVTGTIEILKKRNVGLLFDNNVENLAKKIKYFFFLHKNKKIKYIKAQRKYIVLNHDYKKMFKKYFFEIKNFLN